MPDGCAGVPGLASLSRAGLGRAAEPLVPAAYLEHPVRADLPHIDREAAAVVLDRYLMRLSRHESVCRLRLGRLAARLLDLRGYHGLGFARLHLHRHIGYRSIAVYVSERLGIYERKARSLVRLEADRAGGRGKLADVYRSGRLSWLQALMLLPVLGEDNASVWIERAACVTVRRLQDEVRWALDMRDRTWPSFELDPPVLGARLEFSPAEAERQMRARCPEEFIERIRQQAAEVATSLRFRAPASVIALCHEALRAYRDPDRPGEAAWRAFERVLLHVKAYWEGVPRHRNPIHERDGWRCRVPACSARSRGGNNTRTNRISICAWHHLRGIHTGVVRARGDGEQTITWRLGPQLRLRDDVYVNA